MEEGNESEQSEMSPNNMKEKNTQAFPKKNDWYKSLDKHVLQVYETYVMAPFKFKDKKEIDAQQ